MNCTLCGFNEMDTMKVINIKPPLETDFGIPDEKYRRTIKFCSNCGVYNNVHDFNLDDLYLSKYYESTYSNQLETTYTKIMNLPIDKSDNKNRVSRIKRHLGDKCNNNLKVLDIGSGLCVFLAELMNQISIISYCIDPAHLSISHALNKVGVDYAFQSSLMDFQTEERFDLITLNKVLEHVRNPIEMLLKTKKYLRKNGIIYIELPDGEVACQNGGYIEREEFYIEHLTIYNELSIQYLADQAGLTCTNIHSIHEPSDKYTTYAFMKPII